MALRLVEKKTAIEELNPDALKTELIKLLSGLTRAEQEEFTATLWKEWKAVKIEPANYIFTIGVMSLKPSEITPYEVAHVVRFVCIQKPEARKVLGLVIALYKE